MAVANFHYITRMSSGFKVYILEGMFDINSASLRHCVINVTLMNMLLPTFNHLVTCGAIFAYHCNLILGNSYIKQSV